ncbi:adenosylcobinamide-phosphate synthase CbiB [Ornithinimicrobium sp. Y1847]|uniref:adenosylcobinamide-phosphate synthase CbiB n=1 Tax=Ornithinimicrobium sp. Y1847 TaxID=3405419 RepID=UPI003B67B8B3
MTSRALGVAVGLVLDRAIGEPPTRLHPVAWFGTAMGRVEEVLYPRSPRLRRPAGVLYAATGLLLGATAGALLPVSIAVGVASAGRMLRHTSAEIETLLLAGDLAGSREKLPWLVGRDPSGLDESGVAAAVVESLAENTVDAVIAPAFWGLVAGAPGVLAHRAVNTMDAMVGHRSERYARFGTAAARLDDVMAWVPARVFAGLVALDAGSRGAGGTAWHVLKVVARDAGAHPSPNAGVAESAVAAALRVELGGPLRYGERVEERPALGDGPRPQAEDIARARGVVDRVELMVALAALTGWALTRSRKRRWRRNS